MELGDGAGWVGGVAGVAAFVTSIFGLSKSSEANRLAREANSKSDESNNIARESNGVAREANGIAETANAFARHANDLANRQEARSTESHAIQWEGEWIAPGQYELTCRGSSVALDVVAVVTVDDEEAKVERDRVQAPERFLLQFPRAQQNLMNERVEYAADQRAARAHPFGQVSFTNQMRYSNHSIETWVHWKTETGAPKEHRDTWNLANLGELE
ncbi:hypothetical protein GCM10010372_30820 [Streptomyces tauricus]|uniref:hypothetical protein n=1 Tax=Streptomyces tauricus TaxID=68274 RepID=UPI00167AA69F|nr:hypothetical protein [Streptomyces tauricus]GHA28811.1 hypothetical protein GCM10010372_30820 [Streptomyces tauricus]